MLASEQSLLDWQAVTHSRNSSQSQTVSVMESRSPSSDFESITQEGDLANSSVSGFRGDVSHTAACSDEAVDLSANAQLLSEAIEFGVAAVAAILQPWSECMRASVFNLLRSGSHIAYHHLQHLLEQSLVQG